MTAGEYNEKIGSRINTARKFLNVNSVFMKNYPNIGSPFVIQQKDNDFVRLNQVFNDKLRCYGWRLSNNIVFVPWVENKINIFEVKESDICVSYDFAGCYMAKFVFFDKMFIAHIHSSYDTSCDTKPYWNSIYANSHTKIRILALFQPVRLNESIYTASKYSSDKKTIAGVITEKNKCTTLLINKETNYAEVHLKRESLANAFI